MNKHTPGPWTLRQAHASWYVTAPSENDSASVHQITIAEFRESAHGAFYAHRAQQDARLFTAAPDLLKCCELALHELMTGEEQVGLTVALRAAIAKAKS